jgi:hypothetical protein
VYREGGWPAEAEGDAFTAPYSAPSAGPPPWHLLIARIALFTTRRIPPRQPPASPVSQPSAC